MKEFLFDNDDPSANLSAIKATIPESLDVNFSMYVWPCAVVLAQWVWYNQNILNGCNILEIGAGTALPSIVAAKTCNPASLVITDDSFQPNCIENCKKSCQKNNIKFEMITKDTKMEHNSNVYIGGLTWGEISSLFMKFGTLDYPPYPDIILGSDCFFDETLFDSILFTVTQLLKGGSERNKNCKFVCTFQERNNERLLLETYFKNWNLQCKEIDLKEFKADSDSIAQSNLPGNHIVRILVIILKSN